MADNISEFNNAIQQQNQIPVSGIRSQESGALINQADILMGAVGQKQGHIITNTTERAGAWGYIYALADTVFEKLMADELVNGVAGTETTIAAAVGPVSRPLPANTGIFLNNITIIKLTSGAIKAYPVK